MARDDERRVTTLRELIGLNIREWREQHGLRSRDLAERMARFGWTDATVASVQAGRRECSVEELLWLAGVLGLPLNELLDPQISDHEYVAIGEGSPVHRTQVRAALGGSAPMTDERAQEAFDRVNEHDQAVIKAARKLGCSRADLDRAARELWGHSLPVERDRRLEPAAAQEASNALRTRRGHVTRVLLEELRPHVGKEATR